MRARPGAPGALAAQIPRSRATDGANCTICTGDSVHKPVHALTWRSPDFVTECYGRAADQRARAQRHKTVQESRTLLTAEPLDLDYKHEIIRRVHQERDQAPAVQAEMQ